MARIGVMGGTFDPIHIGHLIAASEVHTSLQLDQVLFVPAGEPWQKVSQDVSPAHSRFEMTKLAIADDDRFEISDIEITRDGPSYAIDTFFQLKVQQPDDEFQWIVGADVLERITTWHRWEEFVALVPIVAVNRLGIEIAELPFKYTEVQMPEVRISATALRKRYADGDSSKYLVPERVDNYIKEQSLYHQVQG
ncbi:MAG: nicotinate-nucleotide adenylyltransferase [Actinomycetes bacterium]